MESARVSVVLETNDFLQSVGNIKTTTNSVNNSALNTIINVHALSGSRDTVGAGSQVHAVPEEPAGAVESVLGEPGEVGARAGDRAEGLRYIKICIKK